MLLLSAGFTFWANFANSQMFKNLNHWRMYEWQHQVKPQGPFSSTTCPWYEPLGSIYRVLKYFEALPSALEGALNSIPSTPLFFQFWYFGPNTPSSHLFSPVVTSFLQAFASLIPSTFSKQKFFGLARAWHHPVPKRNWYRPRAASKCLGKSVRGQAWNGISPSTIEIANNLWPMSFVFHNLQWTFLPWICSVTFRNHASFTWLPPAVVRSDTA